MAHGTHQSRRQAGLTRKEPADLSGLSQPYVSGLERALQRISLCAGQM
ncbi:helix-turn-helix transcriptional regulator [Desulfovibrio sp. OttesenSCG-928-I05]|nr:helix-turn-helix transcriptional regulator [Desulfovibrio sp. OttesenSCG-928-I05]